MFAITRREHGACHAAVWNRNRDGCPLDQCCGKSSAIRCVSAATVPLQDISAQLDTVFRIRDTCGMERHPIVPYAGSPKAASGKRMLSLATADDDADAARSSAGGASLAKATLFALSFALRWISWILRCTWADQGALLLDAGRALG